MSRIPKGTPPEVLTATLRHEKATIKRFLYSEHEIVIDTIKKVIK